MSELNAKHRQIAYQLALGDSSTQIAEQMKMLPTSIRRIASDPRVKEEIKAMREAIATASVEKYVSGLDTILNNLNDLAKELVRLSLNAESETVRQRAIVAAMNLAKAQTLEKAQEVDTTQHLRLELGVKQEPVPELRVVEGGAR